MTEAAFRDESETGSAGAHWPKTARPVLRAIGEARRGVAVLITGHGDDGAWLALPAETASPDSLAECLALARQDDPPLLLLGASRAAWGHLGAAVLPGAATVAALRLPPSGLTVENLQALADPTVRRDRATGDQAKADVADPATAPRHFPVPAEIGRAALMLAKLARLLPAMLVVRGAASGQAAGGRLFEVKAAAISAYPDDAARTLAIAAAARVPLEEAEEARLVAFRPADGGIEHLALVIGKPALSAAPLVRLHSECFTGDLLGSRRCDCGPQMHQAIRRMAAEGAGVLLYLAQEGRGIGLVNKLRAYQLQDQGLDTLDANQALGFDADERRFGVAARMLTLLGIPRIRLLTNNPDKIAGLRAHGIDVAGRVSHAIAANGENDKYLETKARRFGHLPG